MQNTPLSPALAYIYIRWSDETQANGDSLERQIAATTERCERHGFAVAQDRILIDDGRSAYAGAHLANGQLGQFITDAQRGLIPKNSILVIEHYDRIARLPLSLVRMITDILIAAGVRIGVVGIDHVLDSKSTNQLLSQMLLLVYAEIAHASSAQKSDRQSAAWRRKIADAISGRRVPTSGPRWLDRVAEDWQPNAHANTVVLIFNLCLLNFGATAIARHLNEAKTPVLAKLKKCGGEIRQGRGGRASRWTASSVLQILRSHSAYGAWLPRRAVHEFDVKRVTEEGAQIVKFKLDRKRPITGHPIKGFYPEIVSEEMFLEAQRLIKLREDGGGNRGRIANVLAGVLFCATCGGRLQQARHRKGKHHARLYCHGSRTGACPERRSVKAEPLTQAVLERLRDAFEVVGQRSAPERRVLQEELARLTKERDERQAGLDELMKSVTKISASAVAVQFERACADVAALSQRVAEHEARLVALDTIETAHVPETERALVLLRVGNEEERDQAARTLNAAVKRVVHSVTVVLSDPSRSDWLLTTVNGWASTRSGDPRWYSRLKLITRTGNLPGRDAQPGTLAFVKMLEDDIGPGKEVAARIAGRVGAARLTSRPFGPLSPQHARKLTEGWKLPEGVHFRS